MQRGGSKQERRVGLREKAPEKKTKKRKLMRTLIFLKMRAQKEEMNPFSGAMGFGVDF